MTPTLAIVIVSWNVRDLLAACLRAVDASLAGSGIAYRVVVVDNASSDGTAAMVRACFPAVTLLASAQNLGFVGGNNLALRALGFGAAAPAAVSPAVPAALPRYVLLLNPDTEPQHDALPVLVRYLAAHPELVAVGPRLVYADGSTQSSRRRFPRRVTFFWESTLLHRWFPANPWARAYHVADQPPATVQRVDWLVGAALLVRHDAIVRAGLLSPRFFMYSEELEWQARLQGIVPPPARTTPQQVGYLPDAVVLHHEGRSSEQVPLMRLLHFQRSRLQLATLWYGDAFAGWLRRFIGLSYLYEVLIEAGKYLLRHRRDLRRSRIRTYGAVRAALGSPVAWGAAAEE